MAMTWNTTGPTKVQIALNAASPSWEDLGRTDNENLVRVEVEDHLRSFTRNDLGDMTAEVCVTGSTARVSFALVHWDEDVVEKVFGQFRLSNASATDADEGKYGTVGALMVTDDHVFSLRLLTSRSGAKSYTFKYVRPVQPVGIIDFGNVEKRLVFVLESIPDPTTGKAYAVSINS
jgi:hypothetical protein